MNPTASHADDLVELHRHAAFVPALVWGIAAIVACASSAFQATPDAPPALQDAAVEATVTPAT